MLLFKTSFVLSKPQIGAFQVFSNNPFEGAFAIYDLPEDFQYDDVAIEVVQDEDEYASRKIPYFDYLKSLTIQQLKGDGEIAVFVRNEKLVGSKRIAILLKINLPDQDPLIEEILTAPRLRDQSVAEPDFVPAPAAEPAPIPEPLPEIEEVSFETIDIISSDNLENISQAIKQAFYRQESLSLEQVMTAVRRTNIYAFSDYELLPDTKIEKPSYEEISSQSARLAKEEIQQNYGPLLRDRPRGGGGSRLSLLALETQDEISSLIGELNELDGEPGDNFIEANNQEQRLDSLSQQIALKAQQLEALERKIQDKQRQAGPSIESDAYGDIFVEYEFVFLLLLCLIIATLIYKFFIKSPEVSFVPYPDAYSGSSDRFNDFSFSDNNPAYGQNFDPSFQDPRAVYSAPTPQPAYPYPAPTYYPPPPPQYPHDNFVTIPKQTYLDLTQQPPHTDTNYQSQNFPKKKSKI